MGLLSSIFGSSKPSEQNSFEILRDDGVRAMQMREMAYAEKCFKKALELQHDLKVVGLLAEVYLRTQNNAEALPLLEELNASEENRSLELQLLLAQTQGEMELYADEQKTCQTILADNPQEERALYLAAEAEAGLDNLIQAIVNLTRCLALRPDFERAKMLRAQVLCRMGQWSEAQKDADDLVEADAENEDYVMLHAECLMALNNLTQAQADLENVHNLNPFNQKAILQLGQVYETTSQWDKALALYDEAIELIPDFALAYKARGGVKHHLKDDAGAAEDLKRMLELAPENAAELEGKFTNVENEMNARYRSMNPYGF